MMINYNYINLNEFKFFYKKIEKFIFINFAKNTKII